MAKDSTAAPGRGPRPAGALAALALCAAFLFVGFLALGTWQVERRVWKLDLIARVEQRVHATPTPAPGQAQWPQINATADEYRHVTLSGSYLHDKETLVQASTVQGTGFWVLTPLQLADGSLVLVNRGFVPPEARERATRRDAEPQGNTTVTGLLRLTEPDGGFLRRNDATDGRWYSRDVQAIAASRGLAQVAPYFVDADTQPSDTASATALPVAGLTVINFHNSHLVYALTWYTLALMVAGASWFVARVEWRLRRAAKGVALS
ncbi:MAG: SURF1 family protein [Burkholderiales bacterium]|nr:SURF1 family protein [Burkholderiales bacterium]